MRRTIVIAACFAVSIAPKVLASDFVAANGATLPAPDVERLTCADRSTLLLEYALSGYRGIEPLAEGHPDRAIYEYENRLAQIYYLQCQAGASQFQSLTPAFSSGFR